MTREIKFRAWHKTWSAEEIDKSDWHTRGQKINGMQWVKSLGYSNRGNFWVHLSDWADSCSADDVHLMQFTGLTDKNGKEIYEGDVVKGVGGDNVGQSEVFYNLGVWQPFSYLHDYDGRDFEVIGNIYENPELLKQ